MVLLLAAFMAAPAIGQGSGAAIYKSKCAMCHGADGVGATPMGKMMKLRSFTSPEDVKATDAQLFKDTKDGVGRMHGYAGKLTDTQIREVVTYIRSMQK